MAYVLLPCDIPNWLDLQRELTHLLRTQTTEELIAGMLKLQDSCSIGLDPDDTINAVEVSRFDGLWYFLEETLNTEEKAHFFKVVHPSLVKSALSLKLFKPSQGFKYSLQQEESTMSLDRTFVMSLLANAFFCTFPRRTLKTHPTLQDFSFSNFFRYLLSFRQQEKLNNILRYFEILETEDLKRKVHFRRQVLPLKAIPTLPEWLCSDRSLCPLLVRSHGNLEDSEPYVYKAYKCSRRIGENTLRNSETEESTLFCRYPELLTCLCFVESLADNEALVAEGLLSSTNHIVTDICLMDICDYFDHPFKQYEDSSLLRELNKALVAFIQPKNQIYSFPVNQNSSFEETISVTLPNCQGKKTRDLLKKCIHNSECSKCVCCDNTILFNDSTNMKYVSSKEHSIISNSKLNGKNHHKETCCITHCSVIDIKNCKDETFIKNEVGPIDDDSEKKHCSNTILPECSVIDVKNCTEEYYVRNEIGPVNDDSREKHCSNIIISKCVVADVKNCTEGHCVRNEVGPTVDDSEKKGCYNTIFPQCSVSDVKNCTEGHYVRNEFGPTDDDSEKKHCSNTRLSQCGVADVKNRTDEYYDSNKIRDLSDQSQEKSCSENRFVHDSQTNNVKPRFKAKLLHYLANVKCFIAQKQKIKNRKNTKHYLRSISNYISPKVPRFAYRRQFCMQQDQSFVDKTKIPASSLDHKNDGLGSDTNHSAWNQKISSFTAANIDNNTKTILKESPNTSDTETNSHSYSPAQINPFKAHLNSHTLLCKDRVINSPICDDLGTEINATQYCGSSHNSVCKTLSKSTQTLVCEILKPSTWSPESPKCMKKMHERMLDTSDYKNSLLNSSSESEASFQFRNFATLEETFVDTRNSESSEYVLLRHNLPVHQCKEKNSLNLNSVESFCPRYTESEDKLSKAIEQQHTSEPFSLLHDNETLSLSNKKGNIANNSRLLSKYEQLDARHTIRTDCNSYFHTSSKRTETSQSKSSSRSRAFSKKFKGFWTSESSLDSWKTANQNSKESNVDYIMRERSKNLLVSHLSKQRPLNKSEQELLPRVNYKVFKRCELTHDYTNSKEHLRCQVSLDDEYFTADESVGQGYSSRLYLESGESELSQSTEDILEDDRSQLSRGSSIGFVLEGSDEDESLTVSLDERNDDFMKKDCRRHQKLSGWKTEGSSGSSEIDNVIEDPKLGFTRFPIIPMRSANSEPCLLHMSPSDPALSLPPLQIPKDAIATLWRGRNLLMLTGKGSLKAYSYDGVNPNLPVPFKARFRCKKTSNEELSRDDHFYSFADASFWHWGSAGSLSGVSSIKSSLGDLSRNKEDSVKNDKCHSLQHLKRCNSSTSEDLRPVATHCNIAGDCQLLVIILWIAASRAGLPSLIVYTDGDQRLSMVTEVYHQAEKRKWTVGDVACETLRFCRNKLSNGQNKSSRQRETTLFRHLIGKDNVITSDL
ncbi:uncharacterized protein LOC143247139 [Tachypleus tridentatus]|uniref:uncharacterized protein LOC143247139 n=1 Tax=Tachypleus tridentatus TaxID=6853 RepID=UPI003FD6295E